MLKLYHGTRYRGKLDCEDLEPSDDGMIHFHTYPAGLTRFGDNVVVCDSELDLDDLPELPDLGDWDPSKILREVYSKGIITEAEYQDLFDGAEIIYTDDDQMVYVNKEKVNDLLQSKGIKAFKYINEWEDDYKGGYSVAVLDNSIISNPQYYYPGQGRDEALRTSTSLPRSIDPEPPFNYSGYKRDQALKDIINQYKEHRRDHPPSPTDGPTLPGINLEYKHVSSVDFDDIRDAMTDYDRKYKQTPPKPPKYTTRRGRGSPRR